MSGPDFQRVTDCLEAQAFYTAMSEKHRAFSRGVRACTSIERANDVMAEAFTMRAETLTKVDTEK